MASNGSSKGTTSSEIIPMGKAIAIIGGVVFGVVALVGGGMFLGLQALNTNPAAVVQNEPSQNKPEQQLETLSNVSNENDYGEDETDDSQLNEINDFNNRLENLVTHAVNNSAIEYVITEIRSDENSIYVMAVNEENEPVFIFSEESNDINSNNKTDILNLDFSDGYDRIDITDFSIDTSREQVIKDLQTELDIRNGLNEIENELNGKELETETLSESDINKEIEFRNTSNINHQEKRLKVLELWEKAKKVDFDFSIIEDQIKSEKKQAAEQKLIEKNNEFKEALKSFIEALKKKLKDPSSLQIHEVRYDGDFYEFFGRISSVYFDYSAKNGFGGYTRGKAHVFDDGYVSSTENDSTYVDIIISDSININWELSNVYEGELPDF